MQWVLTIDSKDNIQPNLHSLQLTAATQIYIRRLARAFVNTSNLLFPLTNSRVVCLTPLTSYPTMWPETCDFPAMTA